MISKSQNLHGVLLEIIEEKEKNLGFRHSRLSEKSPYDRTGDASFSQNDRFRQSILNAKNIAIIAELKFASPSEGVLGLSSDLLQKAMLYKKAGADIISIITEQYFFKGDPKFVPMVKKHLNIPVLQKDFVINEEQILEAKKLGSDALLLIARIIDSNELSEFVELCFTNGIEPVIEIHNKEDLKKAVATSTRIIAVNARDLETLNINVEKACELIKEIPEKYIKLGFSGIKSIKEVKMYKNAGVKGVLVGASLMKAGNVEEFLISLRKDLVSFK